MCYQHNLVFSVMTHISSNCTHGVCYHQIAQREVEINVAKLCSSNWLMFPAANIISHHNGFVGVARRTSMISINRTYRPTIIQENIRTQIPRTKKFGNTPMLVPAAGHNRLFFISTGQLPPFHGYHKIQENIFILLGRSGRLLVIITTWKYLSRSKDSCM